MTRSSPKLGVFLLSSAVLVASYVCTAAAGFKPAYAVTVNVAARTASGSAGTARNSSDGVQFIWCALQGTAASVSAVCTAHDAVATTPQVICTTSNANMVAAAKAMTSDSYVLMQWDASGACTQIQVTNGSLLEPKKP
jgi:hypothetical protein